MTEIKTLEGGLNTDDSAYRLPKGDYQDALNISKDAIEGSNDKVITNVVANRVGDIDFVYPSGRGKSLGAYGNNLRNTIIWMRWNINGYHQVLEFNATTRTQTKIFTNLTDSDGVDILGFTEDGTITSINVYNRDEGDLLYFIDSLGRTTYMDIDRMKSDFYVPVTRDIIDACTSPPLQPPTYVYNDDTTKRVNYFRNLFVRAKYRWVLEDNTKTTYSPISQVAIPTAILDLTVTNNAAKNNNISIAIGTGAKNVKAIEIAISYAQKTNVWSDFQTIITLNKNSLSIPDDNTYTYIFYNDSTYPVIDARESILLFDWLPDYANCQELLNGNVLGYGGITEGYNNDLVPNVVNSVFQYIVSISSTGSLTAVINALGQTGSYYDYHIVFSGIPAVGTVINVKAQKKSDSTFVIGGTYTTPAGANATIVALQLQASVASINLIAPVFSFGALAVSLNDSTYFHPPVVEIIAPTSSSSFNSIAGWKWSTQRNISIVYYDKKGKTNGVVYTDKIVFPAYQEDISGGVYLPYISTAIYHIPPIWAYSFQFLFTKENTYSLFWCTNAVNTSETSYIYFDVTGFVANATQFPTTEAVLSYSFQDGDRLRLIKPIGVNTYNPDTFDTQILGLLVDPVINNIAQTGKQFLKINKVAPFSTYSFTQDNYEIEIYRPAQQTASGTNQTYYECGQQYNVLFPGTALRRHSGMITDQSEDLTTPATFEFKQGDWYFRVRNIALTASGAATFNVMDRNIVDTYISAVNSIDGRPNVIDINARRAYYGALIRHAQAYQPNTNINGLNRFYGEDFVELDYSYGDIRRLKNRDRYVRAFQTLKIGVLPIFNQISRNADGTQLLVVTDKLLNPVQYYVGNFGIGNHPESLSSNNFADYGCDDIHGVIWRVSNDGVQAISILYKVNSWANENIPLRKANHKIYGAYDQKLSNYIAALEVIQCVTPEVEDFTLNTAMADTLFLQTVSVIGNKPFILSNITKPSWLSITVEDYVITFTGTPDSGDIGTDIPVSFDISNTCGSQSISKTITVEALACIAVSIIGSPSLPAGNVGAAYSYSFDLLGTAPFTLSGITKPSWMSINVAGSTILFTGTPDASGTAIPVSFTINNCSSDTALFSDTFDVSADNYFFSYTNNVSSLNFNVKIGNNNSSPSNTIYSGTYSTDPITGSDIVNLPAVNAVVLLTVVGKTILSANCNGSNATLAGSSCYWTTINGGTLNITFLTN